ncbi:MAG: LLM class flavin-dependent oxidoreductase, partial [Candidatus Aenigmarchaeota archaeon]|nr:LLM class flavin-dependent oxidoreductase [Candidatus Aenigmarchaeota archaeon]
GHLADDGQAAKDEYYEMYAGQMRKGLRNRFPPHEITRPAFDHEAGPHGAIFAGDAKAAIAKILYQKKLLGLDRIMLQLDWIGLPYRKLKRSVEILGMEVAPAVRNGA